MDSPRRQALRGYLVEVTRDLIARGILRAQRGHTLEAILLEELPTIVAEARDDLTALGLELGTSVIGFGVQAIGRFLQRRR